MRKQLHADLAAHQVRWDEAAAALGLDDLNKRDSAAQQCTEAVAESLLKAPAGNLGGIATKLTLIPELGEPSPRDQEFPWPQLRSALDDLHRVANVPLLFP